MRAPMMPLFSITGPSLQIDAGDEHTCAIGGDGGVACWGVNANGQSSVPAELGSVTQLSAGGYHTCALKSGGSVTCWGANGDGQATVPSGLGSVTQLSAGGNHTCALKSDGSVACWGANGNGQATVPLGLGSVTQVSAGGFHTCAVRSDGTAGCWGNNGNGQTSVPAGLGSVTHLSAGGHHTCALKSDGSVACWGRNFNGQTNVPAGLGTVTQLSAGFHHSCAVKSSGSVACWGRNFEGQSSVPAGLGSVTQLSAGLYHTCAVKSDGSVQCWGFPLHGGGVVEGGFVDVDPGDLHACALKSDGSVLCWGRNQEGQSSVPGGLGTVTQVNTGNSHSCALKSDGSLTCWGHNFYGQASVPAALGSVTQVSAGQRHTCAVKTDGSVACWGTNDFTELNVPAGLGTVTHLSAGANHTCAVKSDGSVACWGDNTFGQTNDVPAELGTVTQVTAGDWHTCAIKSDGNVGCWGYNGVGGSLGQARVPAGLGSVTQLGAGRQHTCAVKSDGSVACWGDNSGGQTSVPAELGSVTRLRAGGNQTCAVISDGTIECWGSPTSTTYVIPEVCDGADNDGDGQVDEGCDADSDGVVGPSDNCPAVANPTQTNTDGDAEGDACDADDDNDGVTDAAEIAAGSDPLNAVSTPEVCDGADNDGDGQVDEACDADSDGVVDPSDNCPAVANPTQTNTDADAQGDACDDDDDNDGVTDAAEIAAGSDPLNAVSTPEVCDGVDNDLDGLIDDGFPNTDGDAMANCVDPDDENDGLYDSIDDQDLVVSNHFTYNATAGTVVQKPTNVNLELYPGGWPSGVMVIMTKSGPVGGGEVLRIEFDGKHHAYEDRPGLCIDWAQLFLGRAECAVQISDPPAQLDVNAVQGGAEMVSLLNGQPLVIGIANGATAKIMEFTNAAGALTDVIVEAIDVAGGVTVNGNPLPLGSTAFGPRFNAGTNNTLGDNRFSLTLSAPVAAAGDLLVAQVVVSKDIAQNEVICAPPGWQLAVLTKHSNTDRSKINQAIFYSIVTESQASTPHTWTFRQGNCSGRLVTRARGAAGGIIRYSGVDVSHASGPIDRFAGAGTGSSSSELATAPSVTTTTDGAHVIRVFAAFKATSFTPSGSPPRVFSIASTNNRSERTAGAFDAVQGSAGQTGQFTAGIASSAEWLASTIALRMRPVR